MEQGKDVATAWICRLCSNIHPFLADKDAPVNMANMFKLLKSNGIELLCWHCHSKMPVQDYVRKLNSFGEKK